MKIHQAGAEFSIRTDRQGETNSRFSQFANAPKNGTELLNTLHDLTSIDVDTDDDDDDDDEDNDNKGDKFHFVSQCAYVHTRKHF